MLFEGATKIIAACERRLPKIDMVISHRFEVRDPEETEMIEYTGGLNSFTKKGAENWIDLVEDLRDGSYMSSAYKKFNESAAADMILPKQVREPFAQRALDLEAERAVRELRASQASSSSTGGTKQASSSLTVTVTADFDAASTSAIQRNPFTTLPPGPPSMSITMSDAARANLFKTPASSTSVTAASDSVTTTTTTSSAPVTAVKITQSPATTTQTLVISQPANSASMTSSDDDTSTKIPPVNETLTA